MSISRRKLAIVAITLLALVLGGTTQLWAQVIVASAMGLLLLIDPPNRGPSQTVAILAGVLMLLALAAFLPAGWGPQPAWRAHLLNDLHLELPATRTPQPWATAQACCLLFIGLLWVVFLFSVRWDAESRLKTAQVFVFGMAILASVAVAAFVFNFHIAIWDQQENRGWFPNRNQTADVLVLAGILNYALMFDRLRKRRIAGYFLLVSILPLAAALVVSYSRAGILLFFGGIILWHMLPWRTPPSPHSPRLVRNSAKWPVLGAALLLGLLSLFFTFGGETLSRFNRTLITRPEVTEFRIAVQQDALRFSTQSPLLGVGLGNFEPLFAMERRSSIEQNRAVHPESDWLWATCEMGWLAPLVFLIGFIWWLRACLPFESESGESFRKALVVATVVFTAHGLIDVAGHRLGSACVGLLLASMALPASQTSPSRVSPLLFRLGALITLFFICTWWTASLLGRPSPPTSATLVRLDHRIRGAVDSGLMTKAEDLTSEGLKIAPLDAPLHFQRAYAEVFQQGKTLQAAADFQVARDLTPHWMPICLDEGTIWLQANEPDRCLDAFEEALRRATENQTQLYFHMLQVALANPIAHAGLGEMAADHPEYLVIFINNCDRNESKRTLSTLLARDPNLDSLTSAQRSELFRGWWGNDQAGLLDGLNHHPSWINEGWPYLAQSWADQKDFEQAWKLVADHASPPPLSSHVGNLPLVELEQDFYTHPTVSTGTILYLGEIGEGKSDDALATVRTMEKLPDHPRYVAFLEAKLWAEKKQWELAWNAWRAFNG